MLVRSGATLLFLIPSCALADNCSWDGRQIAFGGRECLNGTCATSDSRLRILGDKVLYTPAPLLYPNDGWVFYIGREVDMAQDPLNSSSVDLPVVPDDEPGGRARSVLRADLNGNELTLTRHNQLYSASGTLVANRWTRIAIRLDSCNACSILEMKRWGNREEETEGPSTFVNGWCKVIQ